MISYARLNFSVPNVDVTKESLDLGVYCGLFHITLPLKLSREPWVERTLRRLVSDPLANRQDKIIEKGKDNYNGVQKLKTQDTAYQKM